MAGCGLKIGQLNAKEIEQLARDKIVVTNRAYRQIFTPYLDHDLPLFLTSDSLLNGFHVLYEESILRLEQANSRKLGRILKFIWRNLETADKAFTGKPELVAAAKTRAKLTIATAMQLLGERPTPLEPSLATLVAEEAGRVESARGQHKPKWLGPPDLGFLALDYTRYQPCGFYTRTPALQRYFRAVSWLQSIPFRVSKDEELVTILMLGNCVTYNRFRENSTSAIEMELHEFFQAFEMFVGPGDDWSLMGAAHEAQNFGRPFGRPFRQQARWAGTCRGAKVPFGASHRLRKRPADQRSACLRPGRSKPGGRGQFSGNPRPSHAGRRALPADH